MAAEVIVEVRPHPRGIASANALHPYRQLVRRVVVTIPARGAVEPDVDVLTRLDQFVGEARGTARAEDRVPLFERRKDAVVPPTSMAKLHDVSKARIQLIEDSLETRRRVTKAGRKLEKETAGMGLQQAVDQSEVFHQFGCPRKLFDVSDQLTDFDGIGRRACPWPGEPTIEPSRASARNKTVRSIQRCRIRSRSVETNPSSSSPADRNDLASASKTILSIQRSTAAGCLACSWICVSRQVIFVPLFSDSGAPRASLRHAARLRSAVSRDARFSALGVPQRTAVVSEYLWPRLNNLLPTSSVVAVIRYRPASNLVTCDGRTTCGMANTSRSIRKD